MRRQPTWQQRGAVQCPTCGFVGEEVSLSIDATQPHVPRPSSRVRSSSGTSTTSDRPIDTARGTRPTTQWESDQPRNIQYHECSRWFRRPGDMARHKCWTERSRPVQEQQGSVECQRCHPWFFSQGGLAVHGDAEPRARCNAKAVPVHTCNSPLAPRCGVT